MTIGERIKELRKKNDLTQEKLAEYLCVSFQAVSKWECGQSCPDLALIAPMTRLFHVSADDLLGLTPERTDERKAYFDAEYHQYWKKDDHEADLEIARQAVAEYPTDYRYLEWLATDEWYVGYSVKYWGTETEKELLASCIRHYEMILEDCTDNDLRCQAISGLVHAYTSRRQPEEAKKYALMYPDKPETSRDDLLMICVEGEEKKRMFQKKVREGLMNLCPALDYLLRFEDSPCEEILDATENIINAVIPDGNYQHFHITLSLVYMERARIAMRADDHATAIDAIRKATDHAVAFDQMDISGIEAYTCPVLNGYTVDHSKDRRTDWTLVGSIQESLIGENVFAPLREREDFQSIVNP